MTNFHARDEYSCESRASSSHCCCFFTKHNGKPESVSPKKIGMRRNVFLFLLFFLSLFFLYFADFSLYWRLTGTSRYMYIGLEISARRFLSIKKILKRKFRLSTTTVENSHRDLITLSLVSETNLCSKKLEQISEQIFVFFLFLHDNFPE